MLFKYKMNDLDFLDGEAKLVAKEYRTRDMDAKNNIMEKLCLSNGAKKRRLRKL